jgi:hypothetical protein
VANLVPPLRRGARQYAAREALARQRDMIQRELAMMPREKVGGPEWAKKQQDLNRVEAMLNVGR